MPSSVCISSGLAGALQPHYEIGQVLAARIASFSESPARRPQSRTLESSAALVSFAGECGATARRAVL